MSGKGAEVTGGRGLAETGMKSVRMALRRGIWRNEWFQSFDQLGDITTCDLPYPVDIDLKIVMDHDIPKAHDFPPRDLGMGVSKFRGDALGHFTEHGKLKQHGILIPAALEKIRLL